MDDTIWASEEYVNLDQGYCSGDVGPQETAFTWAEVGQLFRVAQQEHGRCVSSVYIDTPLGVQRIGWCFQKRRHYEDTGEPYMAETWVTLHTAPPVTRTFPKYAEL